MSRKLKDFAKKLKYLEEELPEEFNSILLSGAHKFVNTAKDITEREGLVDTGNYRRGWQSSVDDNTINCINSVDYASHLEWGHRIHGTNRKTKGYFVGKRAIETTREYILKKLKAKFKHLYRKQK